MRVLVFGAGGPAGINVVRSLVEARHEVLAVDGNAQHLPWAQHYTPHTFHIPYPTVEAINDLAPDAIHAQPEEMVLWIAENEGLLTAKTLCPTKVVIETCQDKFEACLKFRKAKLRDDRVILVQDLADAEEAMVEHGFPLWIRARRGAGARGSALVENREQGEAWIDYWQARDPGMDFLAEAYLPGRDLAWTSLWHQGKLVASFGRERLEYIYPRLAPSGRTGTPVIAKTIHDDRLNEMAEATVKAVDKHPHGFYSVDLREDSVGIPRPTEINAGRCFTTSYLSTAAGVNFMDLWCSLLDEDSPKMRGRHRMVSPTNSIPPGLVWMRHIDCPEILLDENTMQPVNRRRLRGNRGIHQARRSNRRNYPPEYME